MNKWLLRLFVAFITFALSVVLTGAFRFLFGGGPVDIVLQDTPGPFMELPDDHAQIAAIYAEYGAAQTRHDRAFFERVETENFVLFSGEERLTREADIQWMERQPSGTHYEVRVNYIRVFDTSAVSRGRMLVTYSDGETTEKPFVDVWVKRGGVWQIQSTTSVD